MKIKTKDLLPKTVSEYEGGWLYAQAVRCGKGSCRCASGDLHRDYHYFFRRRGGKLLKSYVPKADVGELRKIIEAARAERAREKLITNESRKVITMIRDSLRNNQSSINSLERSAYYNDEK